MAPGKTGAMGFKTGSHGLTAYNIFAVGSKYKLIKLYPNPTGSGQFIINFTGFTPSLPVHVAITNVNGQLVTKKEYSPAQHVSAGKPLAKGVYMVKIETQKGTTIKKLVVH